MQSHGAGADTQKVLPAGAESLMVSGWKHFDESMPFMNSGLAFGGLALAEGQGGQESDN